MHRSHTHCQAAQSKTTTKACQRVCLSERTADKKVQKILKAIKTNDNEYSYKTTNIKHWGLRGYSNFPTR